jgi:hypothetical protein
MRSTITGFALPGLRKENLELLPLSALGSRFFLASWQSGSLHRLKRTASEDRFTKLVQHPPPVAWASEPVRRLAKNRARPRRAVVRS